MKNKRIKKLRTAAMATALASICLFATIHSPPGHAQEAIIGTAVSIDGPEVNWDPYWEALRPRAAEAGLAFRYLIGGQRGSEGNLLAEVRRNRVQVAAVTMDTLATLMPEVSVLSAPFLFDDEDAVEYVYDAVLLDQLTAILEPQGLVILEWAEIGWFHVFGPQPLTRPRDAKGLLLRSTNAPADREFVASIGAKHLALELDEIKAAMEAEPEEDEDLLVGGLVTIPGHFAVTSSLSETLTLTSHAHKAGVFVANKEWLESLSADERRSVDYAFAGMAEARAGTREQTTKLLALMYETGVDLHALTAAERKAWKGPSREAHERILRRIGGGAPALYEQVQAGLRSYRQQPRLEPEGQ